MTKIKIIAIVERDGHEVARSDPEFVFGFTEILQAEEDAEIAVAVVRDIAAHLQFGLRKNAPKDIKIWPMEG